MAPVAPRAPQASAAPPQARRGQLALALQEILTATVRVRANRQVAADAESFRTHVKQVLSAAEQEARRLGYSSDDVRFALFAVVAFLDESVLNSQQPMFAEWPRKPLQEEIFGGHLAGEIFFQNLRHLLTRQDSDDLADVLEVYQLCMLLGFHGRYSTSETGELQMLMARVSDTILRIRGGFGELSPMWQPEAARVSARRPDFLGRVLSVAAATVILLTGALFVVFWTLERRGIDDFRTVASSVIR
jgi:type VI secretion system protein ImpK